MLSDEYDGINILDFDGVNEVIDAHGNLGEGANQRTRRSDVSGDRSKERKRGNTLRRSEDGDVEGNGRGYAREEQAKIGHGCESQRQINCVRLRHMART